MQRHDLAPQTVVWTSDDLMEKYRTEVREATDPADAITDEMLDDLMCQTIRHMLRKVLDGDFMRVLKKLGAKRFFILEAHGTYEGGIWCYIDGTASLPIQSWIDGFDEKGACLILCSCNIASLTPRTQNAILVLPDRIVSGMTEIDQCDAIFTIIHPRHGEIDSYTMDYYLPRPRRKTMNVATNH